MREIKKFGPSAFALFGVLYLVAMWLNSLIKIWNGNHDKVINFDVMSNNWTAIMVMAFFGLALPMVVLGFAWRHYAKVNDIVLTLLQKMLMIGVGIFAVCFIGVSIDNAYEGNLLNLSGFGETNRIYLYNLIGQVMLLGFAWVAFKIGTSKRPSITSPNSMQSWGDEEECERDEFDGLVDIPPTRAPRLNWDEATL